MSNYYRSQADSYRKWTRSRDQRLRRLGLEAVAAFDELARQNVEQLPVLDHGKLVGMLERSDVARWLELGWPPPKTT